MSKAKNTYSNAELTALVLETQTQIRDLLKSEDAVLAKADDPSKDEPKDESSPPADSAPSESAPPAPAMEPSADVSAPAPTDPSAPPAGGDAPPADPSAAPSDPASAGAPMDPMAKLRAAYEQVAAQEGGDELLKQHFMALKEVIGARMAAQAPAAPAMDPSAPAAGAPPPAPMAPPADASAMVGSAPAQPMDPQLAMKSEKELQAKLSKTEAELEEVKKQVATISKGFEVLMRPPSRKAIRGKDLAPLEKTETAAVDVTKLTKVELGTKLSNLAKTDALSKSDRNLINDFYLKPGAVKVSDLQVLFDKK